MEALAKCPDASACNHRTIINTTHNRSQQTSFSTNLNNLYPIHEDTILMTHNHQIPIQILQNDNLLEKKFARTSRSMATIEEKTKYNIKQKDNRILIVSIRATALDLAMSIIDNGDKKDLGNRNMAVIVEYIVNLLQLGNQREKEIAACALHRLSIHEKNRSIIAEKGGIPPLLDLIQNGTAVQKNQAVAAIAGLAVRNDGNKSFISRAGGVSTLQDLIRFGTDKQRSLALRALYCLAKDNDIRKEISQRGGMKSIIELAVKSDSAPDLKRYASAILELFPPKERHVYC